MGCCVSTNRADNATSPQTRSPYSNTVIPSTNPSGLPTSDSRVPIAHPHHRDNALPSLSLHHRSAASLTSPTSPAASYKPNAPLRLPPHTSLINAPLQPSRVAVSARPVPVRSVSALKSLRAEYFDTRTSGAREMWAALRGLCVLLEDGDASGAQAVLDAVGGTCPSGEVWGDLSSEENSSESRRERRKATEEKERGGGVYDERGERYVVPVWCVGRPMGLVDDEMPADAPRNSDEPDPASSASPLRDAKGKGRATPLPSPSDTGVSPLAPRGKELKVRVRLSHTARDVIVRHGDEDAVEALVARAKELGGLPPGTRSRLVYAGRLLSEQRTLEEQGWKVGQTLNMFVFE